MINPVSNPKVPQGKKDPKRIKAKVVKSKERRRNKKKKEREKESRLSHNQIPPILQSPQTPPVKHLIPLLRIVFLASCVGQLTK